MANITDHEPHYLPIPHDLFLKLSEAAAAEGQHPDQFAIARLSATVTEPGLRARLREAQSAARSALAAAPIDDDSMAAEIEAEVKAYRAERRHLVTSGADQSAC